MNKILLGTLVILVSLASFLIFFEQKGNEVDKKAFFIENLASVDSLVLGSRKGDVRLSFKGSRWRVNERYQADDQLITVLFATLQQLEPKRIVSTKILDDVMQQLESNGIELTLFSGGIEIRKLIIGGNETKSETYVKDEHHLPHVVTIPGYRVYVAGVFELGEEGWRDKRIFNFNWRNFKKLATKFRDKTSLGIDVEDGGSGFQVVGLPETDTTRLNDYLDAVSLMAAQQILKSGDNPVYDSLSATIPELTIEVFDLGDNVFSLEVFSAISEEAQILGKTGTGDMILLSRSQVQSLMRPREYFIKKAL